MTADAHDAIKRIRAWGEARDWRGYDPYDGLASPAAGVLSLGTALGRRVLTQAVKLSPLNLRPLLGISGVDDEKIATNKAKTLAKKILGKL